MCSKKWQKINASVRIYEFCLVFSIILVNQIAAQQEAQQQPVPELQQQAQQTGNRASNNQQLAEVFYNSFRNFTSLFDPGITDSLKFCIEDA